ncbi:hypothetical protein ABIF68_007860 [Bradyrhizobium japonicum]|uniref:hypothetical protein n=1 Tax=Bradyrhizobium TaxID=374 RepID=UPI000576D94F|nr:MULTISPECIES: hypothetical protein [Bradyrhizobium]MBR0948478.1 hypothetical protein [Bradyrhizobium liaoningense]
MLKRLLIAAGSLAFLAAPVQAAGTVPGFSLTPQFDLTGKIAPGCKLYIIQAGTTSTPQNAYQDTGLTQVLPNPMTCDAGGRIQQWFVADGSIKLRLTDKNGVQIFVGDNLLVVGPSSGGGGGGGTIDPTTIAATGDLKVSYGTSVLTGWVRANGRTIGSATSGATERANADCQALFQYLWGVDANLAVSGGRGASAAADWAANKTIALPDWRGRALAGLDDMGNSAAGRLTASYFGTTATVLGASGGAESQTLTLPQLPTGIQSNGTFNLSALTLTAPVTGFGITAFSANAGAQVWQAFSNGASIVVTTPTASGNVTSFNTSGVAHPIASPMLLATIFMKL